MIERAETAVLLAMGLAILLVAVLAVAAALAVGRWIG